MSRAEVSLVRRGIAFEPESLRNQAIVLQLARQPQRFVQRNLRFIHAPCKDERLTVASENLRHPEGSVLQIAERFQSLFLAVNGGAKTSLKIEQAAQPIGFKRCATREIGRASCRE